MQNRATINLFLGMYVRTLYRQCTRRTLHLQFHELRSAQQFVVKMFHFEEFDVLIDRNSHYYMYLENR